SPTRRSGSRRRLRRRRRRANVTLRIAFYIPLLAALGTAACSRSTARDSAHASTIRVGILHSLTGTMAISEKSVRDTTLLAIEEINRTGGVLGKTIEPVVADGRSDWPTFAEAAERL